jgi:hypothetical protein
MMLPLGLLAACNKEDAFHEKRGAREKARAPTHILFNFA